MNSAESGKFAGNWRTAAGCLLLSLAAGCSSGGGSSGNGGSSGAVSPSANGIASGVQVTDQGGNRFLIAFTLTADTSKTLGVEVLYSENQGSSFSAATLEASGSPAQPHSGVSSYAGSPDGSTHQVTWSAGDDLSSLQQHDLLIKVTPYNLSSNASGVAATSDVFGVGSNQAPSVSGLTTPGSTVGGWVSFSYTVSDPDADFVSISGQFSINGGSSYTDATIGGGDGATSISAPIPGASHTISWNAQADLPETSRSNVRFRIRASDTLNSGYVSTSNFSIKTYAPVIDLLTANRIPASMNGSAPFTNRSSVLQDFTLLLPETGFVIWVEFSVNLSGAAIDASGFTLTNTHTIGGGSGAGGFDGGSSFGTLLQVDSGSGSAFLAVTGATSFPAGSHTLALQARDVLGNESENVSYTFSTRAATAAHRPFDSRDVWFLNFTRDNFTISSTASSSGTVTITASQAANGTADFIEDLRILGLNSAAPPAPAQSANLNSIVLELVKEYIAGYLNVFYGLQFDGTRGADSANVQFALATPSGVYSRIAIGGDDPIPGYTIGRAEYDYRNSVANNNTAVDLGVFSTNLIDFYINSSFSFKSKFNAMIPGRGTPLGFHASDVTVLSGSFDRSSGSNASVDNDRYDEILDAVDAFGRVIATILAHEIGHSVGLVANGAPTGGLFGGEFNAAFSGAYTTDYHIDTPGNNIMAAAIGFTSAIAEGAGAPAFNEMNMAYLLERILLE